MKRTATLAKLSPALRQLLGVKALMGGLARSLLLPVLREANILPPQGQVWNQSILRAAEHTLHELRLTDLANNAVPAVRQLLAEEAAQIPALFPAFDSILQEQKIEGHRVMPVRLRLRLAIYANNTLAYQHARSLMRNMTSPYDRKFRLLQDQFGNDSLDRSWLLARQPLMLADIFAEHATSWLGGVTPASWQESLAAATSLAEQIIPLLLLAPNGLAGLHALTLAGYGETVARHAAAQPQTAFVPLAAQGLAAAFGNNPEAAAPLLREARKRLRADMGKRTLPLDGVENVALALALLMGKEPKLLDELDKLIAATIDYPESLHGALWAINGLLCLRRGDSTEAANNVRFASNHTGPAPLSHVFAALAQACVNEDIARAIQPDIAALHTHLAGLPVLAGMLAPTLRRISKNPESFPQPDVVAPDLPSLFGNVNLWERRLENLSHLLGGTAAKTSSSRQRLVWLLEPEYCEIKPMQQAAKGNGWTAGRAAALKRLHESGPDQDWITEQDRRVIACIEWRPNWSGGVSGEFNIPRALNELVGHPLLFHTETREPLTLVRKEVSLEVRESGSGFEVTLPVPKSESFGNLYRYVTYKDGVCTLHRLPENLVPALQLLKDGPLRIPREGAAKIMAFIGRHAESIPLQTNMCTESTQACARPVLRLSPSGSGLRVEFVVLPFAEPETPSFPPGKGTLSPVAQVSGHLRQTRRDFAAERQALEALLQACPTLDEHCERDGQSFDCAQLDSMGTALQALLELQQVATLSEPPLLEWPQGQRFKVTQQVNAQQLALRTRKAGDWFQVSGTVTLDNGPDEQRVLDMATLLEHMHEATSVFVPLGNGEFLTLTRQLRRQLDRLARLSDPDKEGARRIHPLGVGVVDDLLAETAATVCNDDAWLARVQTLRAADDSQPALPSTLKAELRDYQLEGFQWMARLARWGAGACLADDMGLGKTVQTLALLLEQASQGPALVVAPMSVCHNWEIEAARFAPTLRIHRFGAAADRAALVQRLGPGDVLITSYNLLQIEQKSLCSPLWRMLIFDEAQALKNAATKRAKAARSLRAACRVALSGTPIENDLEDLWSLFSVINPGLLGTLPSFRKRFSAAGIQPAEGIQSNEDRNPARQALKALVRPFILRRTKTAVLSELPPRTEQVLRVELSADERALYEAMRRKAMEKITQSAEGQAGQRRLTILAELTRLRRACCHPVLVDVHTELPGSKLEAFLELARELKQGRHKALVFSQFVGHLALIRQALEQVGAHAAGTPPSLKNAPRLPELATSDKALSGLVYQYLDGSTPEKERQRAVSDFQSGTGDLFLISLKAGGQGLNLTAADYVLHLDPWWNPAVEDQASDRAHRMGQERAVTIYRLVAQDTVEEKILQLHQTKRALAADFLSGSEAALSEGELLELFAASRE